MDPKCPQASLVLLWWMSPYSKAQMMRETTWDGLGGLAHHVLMTTLDSRATMSPMHALGRWHEPSWEWRLGGGDVTWICTQCILMMSLGVRSTLGPALSLAWWRCPFLEDDVMLESLSSHTCGWFMIYDIFLMFYHFVKLSWGWLVTS